MQTQPDLSMCLGPWKVVVPPYSFMGADSRPGSGRGAQSLQRGCRMTVPKASAFTGSLAGPLAQYELEIDTGEDPTVDIARREQGKAVRGIDAWTAVP